MYRSIRFKLALWYTIVFAVTFIVISWAIYEYINRTLSDSLDRSIQKEAKWIIARLEKHVARGEPDQAVNEDIFEHASFFPIKEYIEIWDSTGEIYYQSPNLKFEDTLANHANLSKDKSSLLTTIKTFRNHDIRLIVEQSSRNIIYLAMPTESITSAVNQLLKILAWMGPIILVFAATGGALLAKQSFAKINQVIETAQRINADRLYDRIPEHSAKDEIGKIISTFNEMISRLEFSFKQMKQFSADASHELKTPLSVMRAQLETALDNKISVGEMRETIARCLDETLRMNSIIENLLLLAKGDVGQEIIAKERVDMRQLIVRMYEESVIIASQREISVTLDRLADATIIGDEQRLRQMLLNLIDNAVKYNHNQGEIHIGLSCHNGFARITIADTGIGIPQSEIVRIFDRFYRVDKARQRELGGTGLGLSIAKLIAEAHRGTISATSVPNQGSEFTVFLPFAVNI